MPNAIPAIAETVPGFESIGRYLAHDHGCTLRLQLSDRIARVFDDDAVYRPELLLDAVGDGDDRSVWERRLWRALVERHGPHHQAARAERLLHALTQRELAAKLPERLCVFGISHLPPLYLRVLNTHSGSFFWRVLVVAEPGSRFTLVEELTSTDPELAARGEIKPLVSERVPLGGASAAVQRVADGVTTGRVAVLPGLPAPSNGVVA